MLPRLPIEFNVVGTPVSFQRASSRSKNAWKALVLDSARAAIGGSAWAFEDTRLAITIFYFPQAAMQGDIDNILKLTLDALRPNVYLDDGLIDRILVRRFDPEGRFTFVSPSSTLTDAMASEEPVLYIRISDVPLEELSA